MAHQHFPIIALLVETPLPLSWHSLLKTTIWRGFLSSPIHPSQARITFLKCHFEWHLFPIVIDWPIESLFYFIILRIGLKKNHQRFTIPWRIKCRFLCYTLSHLCGLTLTIPVNVLLSLPQKILSPQPSTSASPHSCTQPQFALECHPNPIYCTAAYLTAISWSKTRTVTSPPKGCPWPSWFTAVKLL